MRPQPVSLSALVRVCLEGGHAEAWVRLIQFLQPLLARVACRVAGEWSAYRTDEIDDIVQNVFLKLGAQDSSALRRVPLHDEAAALSYFKVMTANAARDHFRARYAEKRGQIRTGAFSRASRLLAYIGLEEYNTFLSQHRPVPLEESGTAP